MLLLHLCASKEPPATPCAGGAPPRAATNAGPLPSPLDVLDLCSSWVSHFPADDGVRFGRVAGLGMNAEELAANRQLSEWVVRDLNKQPVLPYADDSFDAVTCTVSIDYLTQPLSVMREVARVLPLRRSAAARSSSSPLIVYL